MRESRFTDPDAWIAAVERAVTCPSARQIIDAEGIDPAILLAVVRSEAARAGAEGTSVLSHEELAELSGVSRSSVLRVRLVLIELGLASLAADSGTLGKVNRVLHHG